MCAVSQATQASQPQTWMRPNIATAELRPMVIAPGHGLPMAGTDVADKVQRLARDFDRVARPEQGRYVA